MKNNILKKLKLNTISFKFKKNVITGLITALPIYITYIFLSWMMKFFHKKLNFIPQQLFPENTFLTTAFEIVLFCFIILILYSIGILTHHYLGKKLIKAGDNFLNKIPLIRKIYMGSKQILLSFTAGNKKSFSKVAFIDYPRKGLKSIGFLTGETKIIKKNRKNIIYCKIFIPSTPNPTTGYLLFLPERDIEVIDISIENAMKLIISGGIIGGDQIKVHDM